MMDFSKEEDVCQFLELVKEHRAHKPERNMQGAFKNNKWKLVRDAVLKQFPEMDMMLIRKSLSYLLHKLRNHVAPQLEQSQEKQQLWLSASSTKRSEVMMYNLLQEVEADKAQAILTKQQRAEAVIENVPALPEGAHVSLTSKDDRIVCIVLQVMRLMHVHICEEDITMTEKWEMVRAKLMELFPDQSIVTETTLGKHFTEHLVSIALKQMQGTDQAALLPSERLALEMLAEDTTDRPYHHPDQPPPPPRSVRGNRSTASKPKGASRQHQSTTSHSSDSDYSGGKTFTVRSKKTVKTTASRASNKTKVPSPRPPSQLERPRGKVSAKQRPKIPSVVGDDDLCTTIAARFSDIDSNASLLSLPEVTAPSVAPNHDRRKRTQKKPEDEDNIVEYVARKKMRILGKVAALQLSVDKRKVQLELERARAATKQAEAAMENVRTVTESARTLTKRIELEIEQVKLQQILARSQQSGSLHVVN